MAHFFEYIFGRRRPKQHNLQEGLFQIASQTCNLLVQVNNTNNISYGNNSMNIQLNNIPNPANNHPSNGTGLNLSTNLCESASSSSDKEQLVVLLPPTTTTVDRVAKLYKPGIFGKRLSVRVFPSTNFPFILNLSIRFR